ncbi:hypothetical protein DP49_4397 [Burkholderia pseudomallei]|nr:hypothetical protein DP49_4397 [Burkholderia pseudomallei]
MRLHNPGPLEGEKQREGHAVVSRAKLWIRVNQQPC